MGLAGQLPLSSAPGLRPAAQWTAKLYFTLNEHGRELLMVQLALYLAAALAFAATRPMWFDELITFNIARQFSPTAIWHLLLRGADPNPPLSHLLAAISMKLLGQSAFALRLPGVCAGAVTVLCIFELLVRRIPAVFASIGVLFYMMTRGLDYSYEARSYPFLICFAVLALLAWRWTHESRRQRWAAVLLAFALACGVLSNYYGVLAFFPIAAGELTASLQYRRIAWRVWIALAAGALPLIACLPLIHAAVSRFSAYAWNKPYPEFITDAYIQMMSNYCLAVALAVIYGVVVIAIYERAQLGLRRPAALRLPEFAAVAVLTAYPVLGYGISLLRGGMISPRFVIPFCAGVAMVLALCGFRLLGRTPVGAIVLLALCFGGFAYHVSDVAGDYADQRGALARLAAMLPKQGTIAVTDSLLATTLHYYAVHNTQPALAARMVFPMDLHAIRIYKGEDSPEQNLAAAPEIYSVPIVSLAEFEQQHNSYYLLAPHGSWLLRKLGDERVPVRWLGVDFRSYDLHGFTPLSHGPVALFRVNDVLPLNLRALRMTGWQ